MHEAIFVLSAIMAATSVVGIALILFLIAMEKITV